MQNQLTVKDFCPMQEISNSIWEMLHRVLNLNAYDENDPQFQTLLRRIKNQAFCMQGILNDDFNLKQSQQYENLLDSLFSIQANKDTHHLVRLAIIEIMKIFYNDIMMTDEIQYRPVQASDRMISNFYQSMSYIENRNNLAETNPMEYMHQDKFDMHRVKNNLNEIRNDFTNAKSTQGDQKFENLLELQDYKNSYS